MLQAMSIDVVSGLQDDPVSWYVFVPFGLNDRGWTWNDRVIAKGRCRARTS